MTSQQYQQLLKGPAGAASTGIAKQSSGSDGNLVDNLAGGIGGVIGQAIGTPFDLVSGPGGTMAGGAIGGALGQGGAEAIQELLSGKGLNWGNIATQGGEGAAFGAIPGVEEAKTAGTIGEAAADVAKPRVLDTVKNLIKSKAAVPLTGKSLAKRAAIRAGTGAIGGGTAQVISNVGQGKPIGQNVPQTALGTAATNTVIPGVLQEGGNWLNSIKQDINQRTVGGPIAEMQKMFDSTASQFVGDYQKPYALAKGILDSTKDDAGNLKPVGLMTNDYVDSAIAKRKSVSQAVEKELQSYLPSQDEKEISNDDIAPIIQSFVKNNYANLPVKQGMKAFLNDVQTLAGKSEISDPISTKDVMNLLSGGNNKRLNTGEGVGSVGTVNSLKRIAGRGYNPNNPTAWNGLYNDLKGFVEKESNNPSKVADLNNQHSILINMRNQMAKFKGKGSKYPISESQATGSMEHARFGPTIGLSAERGMPASLLGGQQLLELVGALAGYHLGGGLPGGVGGYLVAGQMRNMAEHMTQNPEYSEAFSKIIQKGGPTAQALQSLLQQQAVRQPLAVNQAQ